MFSAQAPLDYGEAMTPGPLPPALPPHGQPSPNERLFLAQKCSLYLASDLFPVAGPKRSRLCHNLPLQTASSKSLTFSGERFDQTDLDVLLALTALSRTSGMSAGTPFRTNLPEVLGQLGWPQGKRDAKRLLDSLHRLECARLLIRNPRYSYHTTLVGKVLLDHRKADLVVALDDAVQSALLRSDRFPSLLRERREIGDAPLAKWLHGMAWAIPGAFCVEIERLQRLSGLSGEMTPDDFFVRATAELRRLADRGFVAHFERIGPSRLHIAYRTERQTLGRCGMIL